MMIKAVLLSCVMATPCFALQTYKLVDQHTTQATISKKQHTRIAVEDDRIQQIFGADGQFDVESDEERGQIFLKPLSEGSKAISITIVTEGGLTQDLRLIPKSVEAQSILLKPAASNDVTVIEKKSRSAELSDLMEAMMSGRTLETYNKTPLKQADRKLSKNYELKPVSVYRGDTFTGRVYTLLNLHKHPVKLKESQLFGMRDVAISIESKTLSPKQLTRVFIISKTGGTS